ncbi:hypothetical protein GQ54DRAFT_91521 [Martensiomyces pterosporus]|nr:hypothetical protein GQ54DRAFT_91521 [Martensiomyces pterosporus]
MSDAESTDDSNAYEISSPLQDAPPASGASTKGTRASTSSAAPRQRKYLLDSDREEDFSNLGTSGIPKFAGEPWNVFDTFIAQVEVAWQSYGRFRNLWKNKLINVYLEGRAKSMGLKHRTNDFDLFKEHMEKKFPSSVGRHNLVLKMCEPEYLYELDLDDAVMQAKEDYNSVGADYDNLVPACRLVARIPHPVLRAYALKPHREVSGRKMLKMMERIIEEETSDLNYPPDWTKARKAAGGRGVKDPEADSAVYATTNSRFH